MQKQTEFIYLQMWFHDFICGKREWFSLHTLTIIMYLARRYWEAHKKPYMAPSKNVSQNIQENILVNCWLTSHSKIRTPRYLAAILPHVQWPYGAITNPTEWSLWVGSSIRWPGSWELSRCARLGHIRYFVQKNIRYLADCAQTLNMRRIPPPRFLTFRFGFIHLQRFSCLIVPLTHLFHIHGEIINTM
jgi:hypothetical protein